MVKRNPNTHTLNKRAHPFHVQVPTPAGGWGNRGAPIDEAAERLSGGRVYSWCPSRIYPPVTVFGFQTAADRDTFAAWIAVHYAGS